MVTFAVSFAGRRRLHFEGDGGWEGQTPACFCSLDIFFVPVISSGETLRSTVEAGDLYEPCYMHVELCHEYERGNGMLNKTPTTTNANRGQTR